MFNKIVLRRVSVLLLFMFAWSSTGFSQVLPLTQTAQNNEVLNKYQDLIGGKKALPSTTKYGSSKSSETSLDQEPAKYETMDRGEILSDIEEYYAKAISSAEGEAFNFKPLRQFGYAVFQQQAVEPSNSFDQVISPDYVLGPGDNFTVTIWGIAEGIFSVQVDPEGNIILPKIGVVPVAGVRYGELKSYIESKLTNYYEQVNVAVALKNITGIRVYVVGEVKQPGTYNVSSLSTAYNALFSAGGPTKRGSLRDIRVIRNGKTIAHIDIYNFLLSGNRKQDINLIAGDTVYVPVIGPIAAVVGNVRRSGIYEILSKADLSDVIDMAGGVLPTSYINRVHIERIIAHEKKVVADKQFSFTKDNPRFYINVQDMDLIKVYPIYSEVDNIVYLDGAVKYPGPYQWKNGMTVRDIISSSDILVKGSYLPRAEIVRTDKKTFESYVIDFDLAKLLSGDNTQNFTLETGDRLSISSEFKLPRSVSIEGEVKLPGNYIIGKGERLSSVLKRAGGFTDQAYLYGAVFKRITARDAQLSALNDLINKMETDLIMREREISSPGFIAEDIAAKKLENEQNRALIEKLKETSVIEGRVIIALKGPGVLEGTKEDVELENGDQLMVPKIPTIVNILGEVYNPSGVVFIDNKSAAYYLAKVGGPTGQANTDEIYIIRADGSIVSRRQGYNVLAFTLMPGDSILVPKSFERFDFWLAVKDFTHWFYEATLAFAVIATYMKK